MILNSFTSLPLPTKPGMRQNFGSVQGSSASLVLANIAQQAPGLIVVGLSDPAYVPQLERELLFFLDEQRNEIPVLSFPDWETLPYDLFSPHKDIVSARLKTLCQLPLLKKGILLVPIITLMHRISPKEYGLQNTLWIKKGQSFHLSEMRERLTEAGYRAVPEVMQHGEFAVRGSIMDLFPMGSDKPYRIDLFDNEIYSIRVFDHESQRSLETVQEVQLLPAYEFPLNAEGIVQFRTDFRDEFEGDPTQCSLYQDVSAGHVSPGLEYYLPLFFEKTNDLLDYVPKNTLIVEIEDLSIAANLFWEQVKERHEQYRHDRYRPILEPKRLFLQPTEVFAKIKAFPKVQLNKGIIEEKQAALNFKIHPLPPLFIESRQEKPFLDLSQFLDHFKGNILFCVESAGRREILRELLSHIHCFPSEIAHWSQIEQLINRIVLVVGPLESGFILDQNLAVVTESDLFGKRVMQRRHRKSVRRTFDTEIQSLAELSIGDPVVHVEHGIGRYQGLIRLNVSDSEGEFVALEYAAGDKLYIPVASLDLISRYSGADLEHAPIHRLGTDQWQRAKRKAIEQVSDIAAELLEIYAHRSAKQGFAYPKPDEQYDTFCLQFPFEETPDQQKAIEEVLQDLMSQRPMDRVVCGDVGFGKTEVALRAAFMAVQAGKQVAVLVPTTLLAEQHFQTFTDRFSRFPIKIEVISRFRSAKEVAGICQKVEEGKIDILIGTHKILQDEIHFKTLGLLIIDEEHRFGVKQKETFKKMRSEVDILTLTATPIPRTLNMALTGVRDLSIIATPPLKRLSIKTFVRERHSALITEAILREHYRGGQVYFLHNAVETIEREAVELEKLVPTARIAIAHGQMPERELEQVMADFYHRKYNVLICTTIIETGIDIPTANTIIIDRADKFGLSQLHQLRGRVGRSHHQAYAFCLIPPKAKITKDASKRLEALSMMEELGSGFTLATHDLEIRGAGELLGDSQSGNIQSIGFQLYHELLDEAVKTLKAGGSLDLGITFKRGVDIDLQIPALIPESYIPDVHTRLVLYKRLSSCKSKEALEDLSVEMIDRFGVLPMQTQNLLKVTELKFQAEALGICKIEAGAKGGRFEFGTTPKIDPSKIIQMIQQSPKLYRLEGSQKLRFQRDLSDPKTRIQEVRKIMDSLI